MLRIESLEQLQSGIQASSGWIEIPQETISAFGALSGDLQWIHTDPDKAASAGPYGGTIAHGFLTLSLLSRMAFEAIEWRLGQSALINYGLNKVRFPAPVRAGSRVRGHFTLLGCGPRPGGVETVWQVSVEVAGGSKPACVAEWVLVLLCGVPT